MSLFGTEVVFSRFAPAGTVIFVRDAETLDRFILTVNLLARLERVLDHATKAEARAVKGWEALRVEAGALARAIEGRQVCAAGVRGCGIVEPHEHAGRIVTTGRLPASLIADATLTAPSRLIDRADRVVAAMESRIQRKADEARYGQGVGNSGLRRMLIALAQRPQGLTNQQLGVRAGVSSRSGTFSTYLGRARAGGWVEGRGHLKITEAGLAALGSYQPLPTGMALAHFWMNELGGGASRMLKVLVDAYPRSLSNEEVGQAAGISHVSGTFSTYLGKLRALELVTGRGELRASEELAS